MSTPSWDRCCCLLAGCPGGPGGPGGAVGTSLVVARGGDGVCGAVGLVPDGVEPLARRLVHALVGVAAKEVALGLGSRRRRGAEQAGFAGLCRQAGTQEHRQAGTRVRARAGAQWSRGAARQPQAPREQAAAAPRGRRSCPGTHGSRAAPVGDPGAPDAPGSDAPGPDAPPHTPPGAAHLHEVGGQAAAAVGVEVGQGGGDPGGRDPGAHRQLHHAPPSCLPARQGGREGRRGCGGCHSAGWGKSRGSGFPIARPSTDQGGLSHPPPSNKEKAGPHLSARSLAKSGSTSRLGRSGLRCGQGVREVPTAGCQSQALVGAAPRAFPSTPRPRSGPQSEARAGCATPPPKLR